MKIAKEIIRERKKDMETVIDKLNLSVDRVVDSDTPMATVHGLYTKTVYCHKYPSNTPNALINNERVFEYDKDYKFYPCNSNDDHISTMLKKILKEWEKSL